MFSPKRKANIIGGNKILALRIQVLIRWWGCDESTKVVGNNITHVLITIIIVKIKKKHLTYQHKGTHVLLWGVITADGVGKSPRPSGPPLPHESGAACSHGRAHIDPFGVLGHPGVQVGKSRFNGTARHAVAHQADQNVLSRVPFHRQGSAAIALHKKKKTKKNVTRNTYCFTSCLKTTPFSGSAKNYFVIYLKWWIDLKIRVITRTLFTR